jgi:1,4-dihydroxy-2-naphthoyl-CoA hydrolase
MVLPSADGLIGALGFVLTETSPDRVVLHWDVGPHLYQPDGIMHGGVHCAAVETAASLGAAAWLNDRVGPGNGRVVGVSNQTDFLRPVDHGTLLAVATPIHRGRSQQLWLVEITDEQDRLVARGQVRLHNLTPAKDTGDVTIPSSSVGGTAE